MLAAAAIKRDANGTPCLVLCRETTQLGWYTGCRAVTRVFPGMVTRGLVYEVRDRWPGPTSGAEVKRCRVFTLPGIVDVFRLEPLGSACIDAGD